MSHNNKNKKGNLFQNWIGAAQHAPSSQSKLEAIVLFAGMVILSILLTCGARIHNYNQFAAGESNYMPNSYGDQCIMFALYALINIGAMGYAWLNATKNKNNKENAMLLGASVAAVGVAGLAALMLFLGYDMLTLSLTAEVYHLGMMAHLTLLKNYFSQYGWLYFIPGAFAAFSFAIFGINKNREPKTSGIFGTASFADKTALAEMNAYDETGSLFGKDEKGNYLYYPLCNRTIIAQPGGGKSTGIVTPALLTEDRPVFVNDPKGELWAVAGRHRHLTFNRESVVLDPYGVTRTAKFMEDKPASLISKVYTFNPLDLLAADPKMYDRTLESLVESLISPSKDSNSTTEHFNEASKTILKGLIEWVSKNKDEDPSSRNLARVNEILNLETSELDTTVELMAASTFYHAKKAAAMLKNQSKGEHRDSLMTNTSRHLNWLDDLNMREFVAQSNFDLKDFLKGNMDVYVVLPSDQSSGKKFVRAVLASLYNIFIQAAPEDRPDKQTLFIFDEQGQLGYFPDIEKMIAELRNCGIVIWSVFQDIGQINQYSKPGLFTGAPLKQFFNIDDIETMEWIQKLGGSRTIFTGSTSKSRSSGKQSSTNQSESEQETRTELIHSNEIREMNSDRQLVFIRSAKAILCEKTPYFNQPRFNGQYDKNPVDIKKH